MNHQKIFFYLNLFPTFDIFIIRSACVYLYYYTNLNDQGNDSATKVFIFVDIKLKASKDTFITYLPLLKNKRWHFLTFHLYLNTLFVEEMVRNILLD